MKKFVYFLSSVAAVSLLVGCGSSGSASSSNSAAPSYSQEKTTVDSPQKASVAASTVITTSGIASTTNSIYKSAFKNKKFVQISNVLNKVTDVMTHKKLSFKKFHKLSFEKYAEKFANINSVKIMDVNNSYCETNTTKENLSSQCINGGSLYLITKMGPDGNECVVTKTYVASNCVLHDEYNGSDSSYEGNDTVNGFITMQKRYVFDENDSAVIQYLVGELEQDKYTDNYIGVTVDNNESSIDKENEKADMLMNISAKYHIDENGNVVSDNENTFNLKGNYIWNASLQEGNETDKGYFKFGSDYTEIDSLNLNKNIIHFNVNGWIDEKIARTSGNDNFDNNYTVVFKNFNDYWKLVVDSNDNLVGLDTNVSGMIGTECLGGMVGLNTEQIIDNNLTDQYSLPNSGLLKITGANNSYAYVKFFQDENGTHAEVNTSNGETKEYNTTEQLEKGSCNGKFVNPFDWDND